MKSSTYRGSHSWQVNTLWGGTTLAAISPDRGKEVVYGLLAAEASRSEDARLMVPDIGKTGLNRRRAGRLESTARAVVFGLTLGRCSEGRDGTESSDEERRRDHDKRRKRDLR